MQTLDYNIFPSTANPLLNWARYGQPRLENGYRFEFFQRCHRPERRREIPFLLEMHPEFVIGRFEVRVSLDDPRGIGKLSFVNSFKLANIASERSVHYKMVSDADRRDLASD